MTAVFAVDVSASFVVECNRWFADSTARNWCIVVTWMVLSLTFLGGGLFLVAFLNGLVRNLENFRGHSITI